jgi:hypothetical protein
VTDERLAEIDAWVAENVAYDAQLTASDGHPRPVQEDQKGGQDLARWHGSRFDVQGGWQ